MAEDKRRIAKTFDPEERIREKQEARDKDQADLDAGRATPQEINRRNAFIPADWVRQGRIEIRNPMIDPDYPGHEPDKER